MVVRHYDPKPVTSTRRLATIGVFSPRHWPGRRPDDRINTRAYGALKSLGFRETVWQCVYKGQLGGLILPLHGGANELHVRFYSDCLEAELEVGRRFIGHFLSPRYQAESIVARMLESKLSPDDFANAVSTMRQDLFGAWPIEAHETESASFNQLACIIAAVLLFLACFGLVPFAVPLAACAFGAFLKHTLPAKSNPTPSQMEVLG